MTETIIESVRYYIQDVILFIFSLEKKLKSYQEVVCNNYPSVLFGFLLMALMSVTYKSNSSAHDYSTFMLNSTELNINMHPGLLKTGLVNEKQLLIAPH